MNMKKRKNKIKINFLNRWVYTFIVLGILAIVAVGVYALTPAQLGHSAGEISDFTKLIVKSTGNTQAEIRSTNGGTPYLGFSNDASTNYDVDLKLIGNDAL